MGGIVSVSVEKDAHSRKPIIIFPTLVSFLPKEKKRKFRKIFRKSNEPNLLLQDSYFNPSASRMPHGITLDMLETIGYSWFRIQNLTFPDMRGTEYFIFRLVENIHSIDKEDRLSNTLNRIPEIPVFTNMVNFIVMLPAGQSSATKTKLRALGRAHAKIGVNEAELTIFCEAFIRTLIIIYRRSKGKSAEVSRILNTWRRLLMFVVEHMVYDRNIVFQSEDCPSSVLESMIREGDIECSSSVSLVQDFSSDFMLENEVFEVKNDSSHQKQLSEIRFKESTPDILSQSISCEMTLEEVSM